MDKKRLEKFPAPYRKSIERRLNAISELVQAKREQGGFTQEELAEKLGVSVMTLQFIEQRRRYPSLPMLIYICDYLGLEIQIK